MKYGVLFVFLFMGMGRSVWSQETKFKMNSVNYYPKKFITHFEVIFGPGVVYTRGEQIDNENRTLKFGLSGGVGLSHTINERIDLLFNFLYENKGFKSSLTYINPDINPPVTEVAELNYSFNYYTLVVLPSYKIINENISIGIGPYFSYLSNIRQQSEIYQDGKLVASSSSRPNANRYNRYDIGITLMGGYKFSLNRLKNFIQLRYNLGLVDFQKQSYPISFYNSTLSLQYGIIISNN